MKVVIIGAGIGGTTTGIALKRHGHDVEIYERVVDIQPVGAAISVWSNGIKCLNYLGLGKQVAALGGQMNAMAYCEADTGEVMTSFSLLPLMERVGQRPYPVARAELQNMLMAEFGLDQTHLGKELTRITEEEDHVAAHFSDGSTVEADLLIGADGARSIARDYVRQQLTERRYAGYVNWNGIVAADPVLSPLDCWTTYVGEGKRVSLMPISGDRFYFFFDVPLEIGAPNERENYKSELSEHFHGWATPVQELISLLDPEKTNRVEVHDVEPFDTWTRGRVVLVGDSAHNTTPDLGQGGCLAMEDAVVLANCCAAHDTDIRAITERYRSLRVGRCKDLVLRARKRSSISHAEDPEETESWYQELRAETGDNIINGIASNIEGGPFA